jgi:hypothetical protein
MTTDAAAATTTRESYVDAVVNEMIANDGMLVLARGLGLVESVLTTFIER